MKPILSLPATLLTLAFATTTVPVSLAQLPAVSTLADKKASPPTEAEIIAKARATYPLKTCLVSDEVLSDSVPYVHRSAGKPDRVIFVCCEGCIDDFKADPAKFLKKVDDASKAATSKK